MKPILSIFILTLIGPLLYAQNSKIHQSEDLGRYLWTQTHNINSKKNARTFSFNNNVKSGYIKDDRTLAISSNGDFFAFETKYDDWRTDSLYIMSTRNSWKIVFPKAEHGFFSRDNKAYFFLNHDTLYRIDLINKTVKLQSQVESFKHFEQHNFDIIVRKTKDQVLTIENLTTGYLKQISNVSTYKFDIDKLICDHNNSVGLLSVFDCTKNKEIKFNSVLDYRISTTGNVIVLHKSNMLTNSKIESLECINFLDEQKKEIWSGNKDSVSIDDYAVDFNGHQIAFLLKSSMAELNKTGLWYWSEALAAPIKKLSSSPIESNPDLEINGRLSFTPDGRYMKFLMANVPLKLKNDSDQPRLTVWNYKDSIFQSAQLLKINNPEKYASTAYRENKFLALAATYSDRIVYETEDKKIIPYNGEPQNDFIIISTSKSSGKGNRFWEDKYYENTEQIYSLKTGQIRHLRTNVSGEGLSIFSPKGNFLLYFNKGCYFSLNLNNFKTVNISQGLSPKYLLSKFDNSTDAKNRPYGIASWDEANKMVWIYDQFDIWKCDLTGTRKPICLTNYYGRKKHIIFRLMGRGMFNVINPIRVKGDVMLKAFDESSKYCGFYSIDRFNSNPKRLYMGPWVLEQVSQAIGVNSMIPLKASSAEVWIVKKQSASYAPNFLLTSDFKNLKTLTNIQPYEQYDWLTSEVHSYKQLSGKIISGVLYKPANFDPKKKYPVIIPFYRTLSDRAFSYKSFELMYDPSTPTESPAWLVNHGYLVFTPDIDFTKGYWGPNVRNSIEGAARYLAKLPFVNDKSIGVAGHSNSGRFGYYLLTHTNNFAAMAIGSGHGGTDILSLSLSINKKDGNSELEFGENESVGRGLGNIWSNKSVWLDHLAVLNADKVKSPLLLMHNEKDGDDIRLATELFTSLWRLQKKVFWLDYENEGHNIDNIESQKDFTLRFTQFFDHYLMSAPAPEWMTKGIPAIVKATQSRYELDPSGTCALPGKECPICKKWNNQFKMHPEMFSKPISEWHLDESIITKSHVKSRVFKKP